MRWQNLVLEAKSLACERGGRLVFRNLSFTAKNGDVIELRGANGSGKSSLLRLIAGLNQPASGSITFNIEKPLAENAHYIGHSIGVKPALTVTENLDFWQKFFGGQDQIPLPSFHLERLADDEARLLSEGQRRRLALSRLVAVARPLWLLDEPTVGLDQVALGDLKREMTKHMKSGGIIIAATHTGLGMDNSRTVEMAEAA